MNQIHFIITGGTIDSHYDGTKDTAMPHTHTATAHLFIGSPLNEDDTDKPSFFAKLFMTHPPLSDRIKRLRETR